MTVIGFEWNQADDEVNHLNVINNKTLILHDGEYKTYSPISIEIMIKDSNYIGEGMLFRIPINKNTVKIEVI